MFTNLCKAPQQIYQVDWRPAPVGAHEDRPQTPGAAAQAKQAPDSGIVKKAAPYRPPSAAARGDGPAKATFRRVRRPSLSLPRSCSHAFVPCVALRAGFSGAVDES